MSLDIRNLVFEGGGVKGVAYAGAIQSLEKHKLLAQVEKTGGTSAGSIVACLVALNFSGDDIWNIVKAMPMESFEDKAWVGSKLHNYGIHPAKTFLEWLKKTVAPKGIQPDTTFAQMAAMKDKKGNKMFKDFHCFASDIYAHKVQEFSAETTPDTYVVEAVRASMSIPLFFYAWQFSNKKPNDHLYVDGGMVYNYPLTAFDPKPADPTEPSESNMQTLGFHLDNLTGEKTVNKFGYGHWVSYVKNTFETLMASQTISFLRDAQNLQRSVRINDLGVSATDFDLSDAMKDHLRMNGYLATEKYLEGHGLA